MKKFIFLMSVIISIKCSAQVPSISTLASNSDIINLWRNSDSLYQRYYTAITTSGDPSGLETRMASIISEGASITNADADELAGYLGYADRNPLKAISDSIVTYLDNAITTYSITGLTIDAFSDSVGAAHGIIYPPDFPQNNCFGAYNTCRNGASASEARSLNGCRNQTAQYVMPCASNALLMYAEDVIVCLGTYAGCVGGGGD
jgi:hypothetical protein